jgi:hypothetical protein
LVIDGDGDGTVRKHSFGGEFDEVFEYPDEVDENIIIVKNILICIFYFKLVFKINKTYSELLLNENILKI